jgi:hypothetical protein
MKTCLVIGNGPSLKDMPLEFLQSYPTFASNRIYLLDGFTPTYYACVNPLVVEQSVKEINKLKCKEKYITSTWAEKIKDAIPLYSVPMRIFSDDPLRMIYEGYTVTYVLLQLAFWKGFERVGLVGVDHTYRYMGAPNKESIATGIDPNHFHPDYFSGGTRWNNPDLEESEHSYLVARKKFDKAGRQVVNLTPGSKLDIFKREDWHEWLK